MEDRESEWKIGEGIWKRGEGGKGCRGETVTTPFNILKWSYIIHHKHRSGQQSVGVVSVVFEAIQPHVRYMLRCMRVHRIIHTVYSVHSV